MPEPMTAGALAAIIVEKAAEQIGARIGDKISNAIFGGSDIDEIRSELQAMSAKIDDIWVYSQATFLLVSELPNIFDQKLQRLELNKSHDYIRWTYGTYMQLVSWRQTIGFDTLNNLGTSWNLIVEQELDVELLMKLPKEGEILWALSGGDFYKGIQDGVNRRIAFVEGIIKALIENKINPAIASAQSAFASGFIQSGALLEASPWVQWVPQPRKNRSETTCYVSNGEGPGGKSHEHCSTRIVPNEPWNAGVANAEAQLSAFSIEMEKLNKELTSAVICRVVLTNYAQVLAERSNLPRPGIKVINSPLAFPSS